MSLSAIDSQMLVENTGFRAQRDNRQFINHSNNSHQSVSIDTCFQAHFLRVMQSGPKEDTRAEWSQMSYIGKKACPPFAPEGSINFIILHS